MNLLYRLHEGLASAILLALAAFSSPFGAAHGGSYFDQEFDKASQALIEKAASPAAAVHAYRCYTLRSRLTDPVRADDLFADLLTSKRLCPLLKDYLQWFTLHVELDRGKLGRAQSRLRRLGFLTDWWILGPFDNEGKSGFDAVYPPEEKLDLNASYKGKERPVAWRPFPEKNLYAFQNLGAVLRPNLQVCAYALAVIESSRRQQAVIRTGSDDAIKVWVNGILILSNPAYRSAAFDQDVAGAMLRKGRNTVLVKVCQKEGDWGFRLRVTRPEGGRLSGVKVRKIKPGEKIAEPAKEGIPEKIEVASALEALEQAARQQKNSAEAQYQLGYFLERVHPGDSAEPAHVAAFLDAHRLAPKEPKYLLSLGVSAAEHNQSRRYFEEALKLAPDLAPANYFLANYYANRGDRVRQIHYLKRAIRGDPDYYLAGVELARVYSYMPLSGEGWRMIRDWKKRLPKLSWLDSMLAEVAENMGFRERAEDAYSCYLSENWTDRANRRRLIAMAEDAKDLKRLMRYYQDAIALDPLSLSTRRRYAFLLAHNGRARKALQEMDRCLEICPEDAASYQMKGDIYAQIGQAARALEARQKSIELHPQNPRLRGILEFDAPERDRFELPYLVDARSLAQQPVGVKINPEVPAAQLALIKVEKLNGNGSTHRFTQEVIKVMNKRGAKEQRYHRVFYSAGKEIGRFESYRVIKPDGRELVAGDINERRVVQGEQNMFYDYRVRILRLPKLEPGDVIELKYRVSDVARRNYFGDNFGTVQVFQSGMPVRLQKYVLIAPPEKKLYFEQQRLPPPEIKEGEWKVYQWTSRDMPELPREPLRPPTTTIAPYVHVSSFKSWQEVADYYGNMVRDQFQDDEAMKETVREITVGVKTDREKIQAIYHYLSRKTRYVALEFGIHGYLPYPARQVFARKYGDCKDKAVLLTTMLKEAGVDARIALLRTRLRGDLSPRPASLAAFDHCIAYVPGFDLWLDCTAEFNGTRELPGMDRGALALVVDPHGKSELRRPPLAKPRDNLISTSFVLALDRRGAVKGRAKEMVTGNNCPRYRDAYQQASKQKILLEGALRRHLPKARVTRVKFISLENFEKPVQMEFEFRVPEYASRTGTERRFQPGFYRRSLTRRYAALSSRSSPLEISSPWMRQQKVILDLPENTQVVHLPAPFELKSEFGSYQYRVSQKGRQITFEEEVTLKAGLIQPGQYAGFREFCQRIDEKQTEEIRVRMPK